MSTDYKKTGSLFYQEKKSIFKTPIFEVFSRPVFAGESKEKQMAMITLQCTNWVNVIPITSDKKIVLVKQFRFGTEEETYELPGGAVNAGEKDLTMAALRELQEETGFTTQRLLSLPSFSPNPAIQNNSITYFLGFDVQPLKEKVEHDDPFEEIALEIFSIEEALQLARIGKIKHALSALGLLLAEPYLN